MPRFFAHNDKFNAGTEYLEEFDWNSQMAWRYRRTIRNYLGFRKNTAADMKTFSAWLTDNVIDSAPTVKQCIAHAESWLYSYRIEPTSETVIKRTIHSALHHYEQTLQAKISSSLSVSS